MVECEVCGETITGKPYKMVIEGVTLTVCSRCYQRLTRTKEELDKTLKPKIPYREPPTLKPKAIKKQQKIVKERRRLEEYEIVENYAEIIRRARESLGWTRETLAQKIRESENVIRRIESGKLQPTIELAKRLERVLGVKLLKPVVEELTWSTEGKGKFDLTLGDVVTIRRKNK